METSLYSVIQQSFLVQLQPAQSYNGISRLPLMDQKEQAAQLCSSNISILQKVKIRCIPAPPISPQLPLIAAWFDTSLLFPYDKLLYEFKQYPSVNASWNLSILWSPTPGNTTPTEITLYWDSSQLSKDTIDSLFLYENNTILTNMLTTSSYSFVTNGTIHRFQIISQNQPSDYNSEQITILILPIFISILIIFTVIFIVFLFLYKKNKKSYEKWKEEKTSFQINEKPKTNIQQKTKKKPTTKKKPQTKRNPQKNKKDNTNEKQNRCSCSKYIFHYQYDKYSFP